MAKYFERCNETSTYKEKLRSSCEGKCMLSDRIKFVTIIASEESYINEILNIVSSKKFFLKHIRKHDFNYIFMDQNILVITSKLVKMKKLFKQHIKLSIETRRFPIRLRK